MDAAVSAAEFVTTDENLETEPVTRSVERRPQADGGSRLIAGTTMPDVTVARATRQTMGSTKKRQKVKRGPHAVVDSADRDDARQATGSTRILPEADGLAVSALSAADFATAAGNVVAEPVTGSIESRPHAEVTTRLTAVSTGSNTSATRPTAVRSTKKRKVQQQALCDECLAAEAADRLARMATGSAEIRPEAKIASQSKADDTSDPVARPATRSTDVRRPEKMCEGELTFDLSALKPSWESRLVPAVKAAREFNYRYMKKDL